MSSQEFEVMELLDVFSDRQTTNCPKNEFNSFDADLILSKISTTDNFVQQIKEKDNEILKLQSRLQSINSSLAGLKNTFKNDNENLRQANEEILRLKEELKNTEASVRLEERFSSQVLENQELAHAQEESAKWREKFINVGKEFIAFSLRKKKGSSVQTARVLKSLKHTFETEDIDYSDCLAIEEEEEPKLEKNLDKKTQTSPKKTPKISSKVIEVQTDQNVMTSVGSQCPEPPKFSQIFEEMIFVMPTSLSPIRDFVPHKQDCGIQVDTLNTSTKVMVNQKTMTEIKNIRKTIDYVDDSNTDLGSDSILKALEAIKQIDFSNFMELIKICGDISSRWTGEQNVLLGTQFVNVMKLLAKENDQFGQNYEKSSGVWSKFEPISSPSSPSPSEKVSVIEADSLDPLDNCARKSRSTSCIIENDERTGEKVIGSMQNNPILENEPFPETEGRRTSKRKLNARLSQSDHLFEDDKQDASKNKTRTIENEQCTEDIIQDPFDITLISVKELLPETKSQGNLKPEIISKDLQKRLKKAVTLENKRVTRNSRREQLIKNDISQNINSNIMESESNCNQNVVTTSASCLGNLPEESYTVHPKNKRVARTPGQHMKRANEVPIPKTCPPKKRRVSARLAENNSQTHLRKSCVKDLSVSNKETLPDDQLSSSIELNQIVKNFPSELQDSSQSEVADFKRNKVLPTRNLIESSSENEDSLQSDTSGSNQTSIGNSELHQHNQSKVAGFKRNLFESSSENEDSLQSGTSGLDQTSTGNSEILDQSKLTGFKRNLFGYSSDDEGSLRIDIRSDESQCSNEAVRQDLVPTDEKELLESFTCSSSEDEYGSREGENKLSDSTDLYDTPMSPPLADQIGYKTVCEYYYCPELLSTIPDTPVTPKINQKCLSQFEKLRRSRALPLTIDTNVKSCDSPISPPLVDEGFAGFPTVIPVQRFVKTPRKDSNFCLQMYGDAVQKKSSFLTAADQLIIHKYRYLINQYVNIDDWTASNQKTCMKWLKKLGNRPRYIAVAIVDIAEDVVDLTLDVYTPPCPAMPKSLSKLVLVARELTKRNVFSGFERLVMLEIERRLFVFKSSSPGELDKHLNLTNLYIGIMDIQSKEKSPALLFIYKCLYYKESMAIPMIYRMLVAYPSVLPSARFGVPANILHQAVQCLVMDANFLRITDKHSSPQYQRKAISEIFRKYLGYELNSPDVSDVLENIMIEIKANRLRYASYALIVIAKRKGCKWAADTIINNRLMPLLDELVRMNLNSQNDSQIGMVLFTIASIVKTYPETDDTTRFSHLFVGLLKDVRCSQAVQEAAIRSLLQISKSKYEETYRLIKDWRPRRKLERNTALMMRSFLRKKPFQLWKSFN